MFVVSDHGFSTNTAGVDVARALIDAGLKAAPDSADVVLASSGQAVALYVEGHDARAIARIARFSSRATGVGWSSPPAGLPATRGGVAEGTFSLELIHAAHGERGAPISCSRFRGAHGRTRSACPGPTSRTSAAGAKLYASDHGSMSPWNVRNTFLAWGVDFKKRTTVRAPAGNVDVAPTILALLDIVEGRRLRWPRAPEALVGGPGRGADRGRHARPRRGGRRLSRRPPDVGRRRPPLRRQELAHALRGARGEARPPGGGMDFGAAIFFTDYSMGPAELARALEERGFGSLWAPEHSHIPLSRRTPFPQGGELPKKYYDVMDPFVTLAAAAAATTRLQLATGVCLVVQRDPIQTAKPVATSTRSRAAGSSSASAAAGTRRRWRTTAPPSRRASS